MPKLPPENRWVQTNESDKTGSLWATQNITLDEDGYIKLSPRSILIANKDDDTSFGFPHVIGRFDTGQYIVASSDTNYNITFTPTGDVTPVLNNGSNSPAGASQGGATFWQNLWFATTDTAVFSRAISTSGSAAWTSRITGLTSAVPHRLQVFVSRQTLVVTNGNVVKQYNTSYANTTDLTIPADFIANGIAYNGGRVGIITRLGTSTAGENIEARFYIWDGATTAASDDKSVGSDGCIGVCAYKSSFAVLTNSGQLLYYNGGGFDVLANFPFYNRSKFLSGGFLANKTTGVNMVPDGERIYINIPNVMDSLSRKEEDEMENFPGGVWCFDPSNGLCHKYSSTFSKVYNHIITSANVNTATDTFTTSETIPATGNIARVTRFDDGATISVGGLRAGTDYYIIKLSSTTFQLATTYDNAIGSVAIDITAADANTYFHLYDIVDYGSTKIEAQWAGAIALTGEQDIVKTGIMLGGATYGLTMNTTKQTLSISVPYLENRGFFITPKIFSSVVTDTMQKVFVKFRPLKSIDKIIVKHRKKDIEGLPTSSSTAVHANWLGGTVFETDMDLSEAKTYLDDGGELECQLLAGAGAGQAVKIIDIATDDNITYSVEVNETPIGVVNGRKSAFIINNWEVIRTITSSDEDFVEIPIGKTGKFHQFKVELRGYETTIEEFEFVNAIHQPSR